MSKRTWLSYTLAGVIGFGTVFSGMGAASANSLSELQNEKAKISGEQSKVSSTISQKENEISNLTAKLDGLENEVKKLETEINSTADKIKAKEQEIDDTKKKIEKLKKEIEELKEKIEERSVLLKERARNIQENGGSVKYMDVLLGAESFGDFVDRVSAVSTIVKADREIMEEQQRDKDALEEKQATVEKSLADLENMKKELVDLKAGLDAKKSDKKSKISNMSVEKEDIVAQRSVLLKEVERLNQEQAKVQGSIDAEEARVLAEKRAAEAAAKAAAKAEEQPKVEKTGSVQQSSNSNSGSSSASNSGSSSGSYSGPVISPPSSSTGRIFTRPAAGRLSSSFRTSGRPDHHGVDIAARGKVAIVAAADGVVSRSQFSSSYGNVVFIKHIINGQPYETVYAHMSTRSVSAGTKVSRGQQIGLMGNTGQSFGQHLHFEVHKGSWNGSKSNAINPIGTF